MFVPNKTGRFLNSCWCLTCHSPCHLGQWILQPVTQKGTSWRKIGPHRLPSKLVDGAMAIFQWPVIVLISVHTKMTFHLGMQRWDCMNYSYIYIWIDEIPTAHPNIRGLSTEWFPHRSKPEMNSSLHNLKYRKTKKYHNVSHDQTYL